MKRAVLFVFFVLAGAPSAFCQTAEVSGLVRDASQRVVPNATVTLVNEDTGIKRITTPNPNGVYTIPFLQPGNYRLSVQAAGFQTISRPGIKLEVGQAARIDFDLQVGTVEQTVTVSGGTPLVNTQDAAVSTVVDRNFAENLPMNGRSFQTLIQMTPGVVLTQSTQQDAGQFSVKGSVPIRIISRSMGSVPMSEQQQFSSRER